MKKYVNGVLVDMNEEEIAEYMASLPSDEDLLQQAKDNKLQELKDYFAYLNTHAIVKVELPRFRNIENSEEVEEYFLTVEVDGNRDNIKDYEIGKKYRFPQLKDAHNKFHDVLQSDYDLIIEACEQNGIVAYSWKWAKEAEIKACSSIDEIDAIKFESIGV